MPPEVHESLRKALRIGVTGHRDLSRFDVARLRRQVGAVLQSMRVILDQADPAPGLDLFFPDEALLTVISPLAAGADQLVAEEALRMTRVIVGERRRLASSFRDARQTVIS